MSSANPMHAFFQFAALFVFSASLSAQMLKPAPEDQARAREIFQQLIEIDTTHEHGSTTRAAEAMRARFLAAGFPEADLLIDGPVDVRKNLLIRYRGKPGSDLKPILFLCHLDVVEALRSDWTVNPFVFLEKDGFFWGRGTQDMKDGDAAVVAALLRMRAEHYVPDRDIVVALTADEEGGSDNGVKWLLGHHADWMQAAFAINPDTGGVQGDKGKIVAIGVGATEKLYFDFHLTAKNRGGHSSVPRPDNAIYELAHALVKIEESPFPVELNTVTRDYFAERAKQESPENSTAMRALLANPQEAAAAAQLSKNAGFNSTLRTTCVATELRGGHAENALPQTAEANVNCRILPGHSAREVREELVKKIRDPGVEIEFGDMKGKTPSHDPEDKALPPPPLDPVVFGALHRTTEQFWNGLEILPRMGTGATDSIYTMAAGIPSYGISGFQIDEGRAHGRDERLAVASFDTGAEFMYRFIVELTKN
jgi:acetylornithine deacetylase/succinyl-diaminopimelate desuccinylase-like protein